MAISANRHIEFIMQRIFCRSVDNFLGITCRPLAGMPRSCSSLSQSGLFSARVIRHLFPHCLVERLVQFRDGAPVVWCA